jgi:hypothetical protein
MNYEEDIRIDEAALDIECIEQARLAMKYGRHWAECRQELQLAEENIKLVRSELIKEANEDPDRHLGSGIKPTAPVVEAYYRNHKRHKAAKTEWIQAQYEANVAEIAYKAITYDKKMALENLVKLHGQQYFAGPSVPRDLSEEMEFKNSRSNSGVAKKLKRKNKQDG